MQQDILKKINQPLILMGYMGSGKTSIGKKISKILNVNFFDLDELIEIKYNKSVKKFLKILVKLSLEKKKE